jgi:hypothetical protein
MWISWSGSRFRPTTSASSKRFHNPGRTDFVANRDVSSPTTEKEDKMKTTQGFANSARLVLANIGLAGDKLEELIAGLNPDAAIAVSRQEREQLLKVAATKLADQRQRQGKLEEDLKGTRDQLATQKKAAGIVVARAKDPSAAQPSEKAKQQLIDSITHLTQDAERMEAELAGVKTAVDFLDDLVEKRSEALRSFDGEAREAKHRLDMANLRKSQAELEAEMQGMASHTGSNAGLGALSRAASRAERDADASEIVGRATSTNPGNDSVMASILAEAKDGPKVSTDDKLAALAG